MTLRLHIHESSAYVANGKSRGQVARLAPIDRKEEISACTSPVENSSIAVHASISYVVEIEIVTESTLVGQGKSITCHALRIIHKCIVQAKGTVS